MRRPRRAAVDDRVDRPQVGAQRCVEPSGTNCPRACAASREGRGAHPPQLRRGGRSKKRETVGAVLDVPLSFRLQCRKGTCGGYCAGAHLFPFRTEKLSPAAPMILHPCGKVGRRPPTARALAPDRCQGPSRYRNMVINSLIKEKFFLEIYKVDLFLCSGNRCV